MSRRKQGSRPQHLSRTFQVADLYEEALSSCVKEDSPPKDSGNHDLLTCGQCGSSFPLSQILVFIEHKKAHCDNGKHYLEKRIYDPCTSPVTRESQPFPSPTNPVTVTSPTEGGVQSFSEGWSPRVALEKEELRGEPEPASYTCMMCMELFTNAWFLLQHAQNMHGLQIYLESDDTRKPLTPRIDLPVSQGQGTLVQPSDLSSASSMKDIVTHSFRPSAEVLFEGHGHSSELPGFNRPEHCLLHTNSEQHLHLEKNSLDVYNHCALGKGILHLTSQPAQEQALNFSTRLCALAGKSVPKESPDNTALLVQTDNTSPLCQTSPTLPRDAPQQEKTKSCDYCGKTFKSASNLVVHRRSHTGEKPYQCSVCEHACTQSSKLKRHMKTHRLKVDSVAQEHGAMASDEGHLDASNETELSGTKEVQKIVTSSVTLKSLKSLMEKDKEEDELNNENWKNLNFFLHRKRHLEGHERILEGKHSLIQLQHLDEYRKALAIFSKQQSPTLSPEATADPEERCSKPLASASSNNDGDDPSHSTDLSADSTLSQRSASSSDKGFLWFVNKRVKLENECEKLNPQLPAMLNSFYLQWMAGHAESLPSMKDARASPCGNSSEHSSDNGNSHVSNPTEDSSEEVLSSESGIASGNCTPKRNGTDKASSKRRDTCEFCGKVFKNSSNLTVHRRSHTGERPYHCGLCNYACAQSSKLTRHMKTHIQGGKLPFQCEICNIPFSVHSTLEKHMKKHHAEAIFDDSLSRGNGAK